MEKFRTKAETAFKLKRNVWISVNDHQDSANESIRNSILNSVLNLTTLNLVWRSSLVSIRISIISLIMNDLRNEFEKKNK